MELRSYNSEGVATRYMKFLPGWQGVFLVRLKKFIRDGANATEINQLLLKGPKFILASSKPHPGFIPASSNQFNLSSAN